MKVVKAGFYQLMLVHQELCGPTECHWLVFVSLITYPKQLKQCLTSLTWSWYGDIVLPSFIVMSFCHANFVSCLTRVLLTSKQVSDAKRFSNKLHYPTSIQWSIAIIMNHRCFYCDTGMPHQFNSGHIRSCSCWNFARMDKQFYC